MVGAVSCDTQVQGVGSEFHLYPDLASSPFASAHLFGILSYTNSMNHDFYTVTKIQVPSTNNHRVLSKSSMIS